MWGQSASTLGESLSITWVMIQTCTHTVTENRYTGSVWLFFIPQWQSLSSLLEASIHQCCWWWCWEGAPWAAGWHHQGSGGRGSRGDTRQNCYPKLSWSTVRHIYYLRLTQRYVRRYILYVWSIFTQLRANSISVTNEHNHNHPD